MRRSSNSPRSPAVGSAARVPRVPPLPPPHQEAGARRQERSAILVINRIENNKQIIVLKLISISEKKNRIEKKYNVCRMTDKFK